MCSNVATLSHALAKADIIQLGAHVDKVVVLVAEGAPICDTPHSRGNPLCIRAGIHLHSQHDLDARHGRSSKHLKTVRADTALYG